VSRSDLRRAQGQAVHTWPLRSRRLAIVVTRPGGRAYAGQRSMTGVPIILCLWFDNMCHVRRPAIQQRRRPDAYTQAGWEAAGSFRRIAANFGPSPFHDASHKYAVSREPEQGTVKLGRSDGAERVGEVACGGSTPTRRYSPPASDNVRSERMWGSRCTHRTSIEPRIK